MEFMLVLAIALTLLAALLPVYGKAQEKTSDALLGEAQQAAFSRMVSLARQAEILGQGNSLSSKISFQAENTAITFGKSAGILKMEYYAATGKKQINETLGFPVELGSENFPKGRYIMETRWNKQVMISLHEQNQE